ncbi:MAG: putative alternative RNA polymerase sigma factor SigM [Candidatus Hydrogenedentota bacterium]
MRPRREIESDLLLIRFHRGDLASFSELMRLWERRLFYYIRRMVPAEEDAWDILQDVWMRAYTQMRTVRDAASLRSWLYCVAHNAAVSHLRKHSRYEAALENVETPAHGDSPAFDSDDARMIHEGIEKLASAHREVIVLYFIEEFSQAEIANILNIPEGTVKSRLHHAKHALRTILDAEHGT